MLWGLIGLIIAVVLVLLLFWVFKKVIVLIVNSVIGIFALIGFNTLFNAGIKINFWSVIITAIGGIIGFIIVLVAHYLHIAF